MTPTTLITGANRGIGAALLAELSAQGPVMGTARSPGASDLLPLDVTDPDSHHRLAERLEGQAIGLLVCNAGVYLDKGERLADGYAPQLWADGFAANVTGVFLTIQSLLPNLQMEPGGRIAIIGSQMGSSRRAPGGSYIYRASKAAVLNLGRNLAADLAPLGIAVGVYHPGWVRTDMGGGSADISVTESAQGLAARFAELGPDHTGVFETWDGREHAY